MGIFYSWRFNVTVALLLTLGHQQKPPVDEQMKMMMNDSNRPTQQAESQPETDSKPPDPVQRTGAHLPPAILWQLDQADLHRSWAYKLSENKIATTIFIQPGIALNDQEIALTKAESLGWNVRQSTAMPGSGR